MSSSSNASSRNTKALWAVQIILAALFLFAGGMKEATPAATLARMAPLPVGFLRFIGAMEFLGALGLILPGALRIRRELTPIAATGLSIIMAGAVIVTLAIGGGAMAVTPFVVGVLTVLVARGRRGWIALRLDAVHSTGQFAN
ncbi:MAG TPA: DoxX family protein [Gemmatimonadales bacterium]|jgi:hypothetical protein